MSDSATPKVPWHVAGRVVPVPTSGSHRTIHQMCIIHSFITTSPSPLRGQEEPNSWPFLSARLEGALDCGGHIWLQDINSQSEHKKGSISPAELIRWKDTGSQELFLSGAKSLQVPLLPIGGGGVGGRDGHREGSHRTRTGDQWFSAPTQSAELAHGHSS